jgi:hypothetical protein
MSTALIIGGVVLGVAVLAGVTMMGKKREPIEDTSFGAENPQQSYEQSGGRRSRRLQNSKKRKSRSRRSRRVKI